MSGISKKANFICSRNTIDGVYPPLILALQARRAGADTMIFFTFDGIDVIRKNGAKKIKYYPNGMLGAIPGVPGVSARMITKLAEDRAGVPNIETLLEMCQLEGVKFHACLMTLQIMDIKNEELIEGVVVSDAASYIKTAMESNVNLFI
ncbi:Peroxiredoxin family protein [Desulfotomaculum arcticum]|uniref:Peroxiredoxin family protein n=1 Tax=Desulfotruncus arcticus DSM 17038 TaxID=1121424 RepID=A0A1I2TXH0_9FIRM|nr:DsrE/DsrF/DrsH-like family protein [Desulfotruncus arcticus]SFG69600.1 Peroxiredoxin family protein [Desulfotomaculum arcticum] [Desulfotruncus arcticus DSM 17038]